MLGRYAGLPSADHGNYLISANALLGRDVSGYGLEYPPIFVLLLLGALHFFDPIMAVRVAVVLASFFLPFPFYALLRRAAGVYPALLGAFLLTFSEAYSEMTAWGGGPDFLGITFMLGSMVFLQRYLSAGGNRELVASGILAGLTVGTHQLTALVYAGTIAGWAALDFLRGRNRAVLFRFSRFSGLAILLSLPFAPLYIHLSARLAPQITPLWPDGVDALAPGLLFVFRDSLVLWLAFGGLAVAGMIVLIQEHRPEGLMWTAMIVASFVFALTILRDNTARPLYFLVLPVTACAPVSLRWAWKRMPKEMPVRDWKVASILVLGFVVLASGTMTTQSIQRMSVAVDWYHAVDAPTLEGLAWLKTNTPPGAVVATAGLPLLDRPEGNRFGWWIEGYSERPSFYTGSPAIYTFREQRASVELANRFFTGNAVEANPFLQVVENAPADLRNPGIYLRGQASDRILLYMNDGVSRINYTQITAPGQNLSFYPYGPQPEPVATSHSWVNGISGPSLVTVRSLPAVRLSRTEQLSGNTTRINLIAEASNGSVSAIDAPVWVGDGLQVVDLNMVGATISGQLLDTFGFGLAFDIRASAPAGSALSLAYSTADPVYHGPVLTFRVEAPIGANTTGLSLEISFPAIQVPPSEPTDTIDAGDIARAVDVEYVFQSRTIYDYLARFADDYLHYRAVFSNSEIVIFEWMP